MIKEAVATGESVEVAFANACKQLGVDTIDAGCEVLEMPQKKTLGLFGGRPAKVRAYIEVEEAPSVSVPAPAKVLEQPVPKNLAPKAIPVSKPVEETSVAVPSSGRE